MVEKDKEPADKRQEEKIRPAGEEETADLGREEVRQLRTLAYKARKKAADKIKRRKTR